MAQYPHYPGLTRVAADPPRNPGQTVSEGGGPLSLFVRRLSRHLQINVSEAQSQDCRRSVWLKLLFLEGDMKHEVCSM